MHYALPCDITLGIITLNLHLYSFESSLYPVIIGCTCSIMTSLLNVIRANYKIKGFKILPHKHLHSSRLHVSLDPLPRSFQKIHLSCVQWKSCIRINRCSRFWKRSIRRRCHHNIIHTARWRHCIELALGTSHVW